MRLGDILFISRARLRERVVIVQELLAIAGIAVGVALLFASQVAAQSVDASVRQLATQLVGATQYQIDARDSEGFPETVVDEVRAMPGVRAALPLLERQATIVGPSGSAPVDLIGADPRFVRIAGPLLQHFSVRQLAHQRAIGLPASLASSIGAQALQVVTLQIGGRNVETLVGATLGEGEVGALADSQIAIAPIGYAQKLTGGEGRVSRVFIQAQPSRQAEVQAELGTVAAARSLNLEPADFDATLFAVAYGPAQQSEGLFSLISAFVGFLFAFTAMLLTVPERRRLIEALRRRGYTRWMVVQVLAFDAFLMGVLALASSGSRSAEVLSIKIFHAQPGYLAFAFPVGTPRIVTWLAIAEAAGAGMLAAFIGVLAPVRDILARPLRAPVDRGRAPRGWTAIRLAAGGVCLAVTTLILIFRPQDALVGSITLDCGDAVLAVVPVRRARLLRSTGSNGRFRRPRHGSRSRATRPVDAGALRRSGGDRRDRGFWQRRDHRRTAQPAKGARSNRIRMGSRHRHLGLGARLPEHAGDDRVPSLPGIEGFWAYRLAQRRDLSGQLPELWRQTHMGDRTTIQ